MIVILDWIMYLSFTLAVFTLITIPFIGMENEENKEEIDFISKDNTGNLIKFKVRSMKDLNLKYRNILNYSQIVELFECSENIKQTTSNIINAKRNYSLEFWLSLDNVKEMFNVNDNIYDSLKEVDRKLEEKAIKMIKKEGIAN